MKYILLPSPPPGHLLLFPLPKGLPGPGLEGAQLLFPVRWISVLAARLSHLESFKMSSFYPEAAKSGCLGLGPGCWPIGMSVSGCSPLSVGDLSLRVLKTWEEGAVRNVVSRVAAQVSFCLSTNVAAAVTFYFQLPLGSDSYKPARPSSHVRSILAAPYSLSGSEAGYFLACLSCSFAGSIEQCARSLAAASLYMFVE